MEISGSTRMRLRLLAMVAAIGVTQGALINFFTEGPSTGAVLQGSIDGLLIALLLGWYRLFLVRGPLRWIESFRFTTKVLINVVNYVVLIQVGRIAGNLLTGPESLLLYFRDFLFTPQLLIAIPAALIVLVLFEFVLQMNRMVGTNVLRYFLTGAYHRPREETRIFLFLDLQSSTRLAESLGSIRYYNLLRRFVDDLTEPILESAGEIYQYAGDEVIITWTEDRGREKANCLRCFFLIEDAIARNATSYEREFGVVPRFRAGLHGGVVIAGELGDLKQEIVFVGDILNTAARLEHYAKEHDLRLVASGECLDGLEIPPHLKVARITEFQPRGQAKSVVVYSVNRECRQ
jgi:adenylate cyclase